MKRRNDHDIQTYLPSRPRRSVLVDIEGVSGELLREPIVQAIAPYSVGVNDEIRRNAL